MPRVGSGSLEAGCRTPEGATARTHAGGPKTSMDGSQQPAETAPRSKTGLLAGRKRCWTGVVGHQGVPHRGRAAQGATNVVGWQTAAGICGRRQQEGPTTVPQTLLDGKQTPAERGPTSRGGEEIAGGHSVRPHGVRGAQGNQPRGNATRRGRQRRPRPGGGVPDGEETWRGAGGCP